jgi:hypothetical protein
MVTEDNGRNERWTKMSVQPFQVIGVGEVVQQSYKPGSRWGRWVLTPLLSLEYVPNLTKSYGSPGSLCYYEVDLEECRTQREFVDWLAQLAGKNESFMRAEDIGDFVRAVGDLLGPVGLRRLPDNNPIDWHMVEKEWS